MKSIIRKIALMSFFLNVLSSQTAHAVTLYSDFTGLGEKPIPDQIEWNFTTTGGGAILTFELEGYKNLDGHGNCCTDIFHLFVNNQELLAATFNMGGGGSNTVISNPQGAIFFTTTYQATDNVHDSHQMPHAGGTSQIVLPIYLLAGLNHVLFSYTGFYQGLNDEGWGLNFASINLPRWHALVPEPNSIALLLIGIVGLFSLRHARKIQNDYA